MAAPARRGSPMHAVTVGVTVAAVGLVAAAVAVSVVLLVASSPVVLLCCVPAAVVFMRRAAEPGAVRRFLIGSRVRLRVGRRAVGVGLAAVGPSVASWCVLMAPVLGHGGRVWAAGAGATLLTAGGFVLMVVPDPVWRDAEAVLLARTSRRT